MSQTSTIETQCKASCNLWIGCIQRTWYETLGSPILLCTQKVSGLLLQMTRAEMF